MDDAGNVTLLRPNGRGYGMGGRPGSDEEAVTDNWFHGGCYLEKRRVFLRSYRFHRKKGIRERLKLLLFGLGGAISVKARSLRRLPRVVLSRMPWPPHRRRRFQRLRNGPKTGGCARLFRIFRL